MKPFRLNTTPAQLAAWAGILPANLRTIDTHSDGQYWVLHRSAPSAMNELTPMLASDSELNTYVSRAILPVTGFVGLRKTLESVERPVLFSRSPETIFGLGALCASEQDGMQPRFTILHTTPNVLLASFFDSQPLVIQSHEMKLWLDPDVSWKEAQHLVRPLAVVELKHWMMLPADVSSAFN